MCMKTFTRENSIWATVFALFGFLVWTIPIWLGAVWVLFKRDPTILSWLASHGIEVNTITVILFAALSVGTIIVLTAFAHTVKVVTDLGPWQFVPSSVRIDIGRLDFSRLAAKYTQPHLFFEVLIENGSGRPITL